MVTFLSPFESMQYYNFIPRSSALCLLTKDECSLSSTKIILIELNVLGGSILCLRTQEGQQKTQMPRTSPKFNTGHASFQLISILKWQTFKIRKNGCCQTTYLNVILIFADITCSLFLAPLLASATPKLGSKAGGITDQSTTGSQNALGSRLSMEEWMNSGKLSIWHKLSKALVKASFLWAFSLSCLFRMLCPGSKKLLQ